MNRATRYFKKIQIKNLQRAINREYEKDGLTDDVLLKQLQLNKLRKELDISDSTKKVNDKYVQ